LGGRLNCSEFREELLYMPDIHIRIQNLTKKFGDVVAVDNVSLEIERGSFTTLLGPSGCGKTTTLRLIAGLYNVEDGEIFFGDRCVNDVPSHQRNATMVFQDYALFPHMTIFENVSYGLRLMKLPAKEIEEKVEKTLTFLGLEELGDRTPGMISGGQQQRAALARSLIMEPEVLLLDEPLSNLDAKLRVNIRAELRQIQKNLGITTTYVTHDQEEALAISDSIAVMDKGRVVQFGSPWEIYYKPKSTFVADFVGVANFVHGRVSGVTPKEILVDIGDGVLKLDAHDYRVSRDQRVVLNIRPETILMSTQAPGSQSNVLTGRIKTHTFVGQFIRYWVTCGQREFIVDLHDPSTVGILDGNVHLQLPPSKLHLLPEENESISS
jgi:ABC-type Fe3+/spermidine/putrescine transport system ATPase subunit